MIAFFSNSASALSDAQGHIIEASVAEARMGEASWKVFPKAGPRISSSGLRLSTINVLEFGRQAHQHTKLQFRLGGGQTRFLRGEYQGRVELRAVIR